jgi:hypothetical protein
MIRRKLRALFFTDPTCHVNIHHRHHHHHHHILFSLATQTNKGGLFAGSSFFSPLPRDHPNRIPRFVFVSVQ